jgi:hypothetical protein
MNPPYVRTPQRRRPIEGQAPAPDAPHASGSR